MKELKIFNKNWLVNLNLSKLNNDTVRKFISLTFTDKKKIEKKIITKNV